MKKTVHENFILKYSVLARKYSTIDVFEMGQKLVDLLFDKLLEAGFFIYDIEKDQEFYSPNFRKFLGFENENDFPNVPESWQKQIHPEDLKTAYGNLTKIMNNKTSTYYQKVRYKTKAGNEVALICSGTPIYNSKNSPIILIGTHKKCQA